MKECKICLEEKELTEFRRDRSRKDGFHPYCKPCQKVYRRKDPNNLIRIEGEKRRHQKYDKGRGAETRKSYRESDKGREVSLKTSRKRTDSGKSADYHRDKYHSDPLFRLKHNVRGRLRSALRAASLDKGTNTEELVGCSWEQLKSHIESQFQEGMNWDNMDLWDHDHIIPLSVFDLSNEEELKRATHYTNIQPLWSEENSAKGDKLIKKYVEKVPWGLEFIESKNLKFD